MRAAAWIGLLALLATGAVHAAERAVTDVQYADLPGERVRIVLTLSGPAPEPKVFTVRRPARLSVDLPGTSLAVDQRRYPIKVGGIRSMVLAEGDNRTRLIVKMRELVPHDISVSGNQVRIELGGSTPTELQLAGQARFEANANLKPGQPPRIRDVKFRRTATGAGRITVVLGGRQVPIDVSREGDEIVVRFPNTRVPQSMVKRLDVIDFATPVKYIDIFNRPGGARIRISAFNDAAFDYIAYQTDDRFIIELQPITPAERRQRQQNKEKYTGKRISLSFQDVGVRAILQTIAEVAGVNMVISESVSGTMALQLENVPWDRALDIILYSQGLGMRRMGDVIMIAPLQEIAQREQAQLKAQKATQNLAPLTSTLIQINYAKAGKIASLLKSGAASLISERGSIAVASRINALLIRETRANLKDIRRIIDKLDVPVQQVLIEARIVVANRGFARSLGIEISGTDFGSFASPSDGNYQTKTGFTISLPVAGPTGTLSTTILGDTFSLNLALTAMESENRGRIISAPRVITTSGHKARIEQGQEVPYLASSGEEGASIAFKKAVLSLTVTPRITPNNYVIMDLKVTQDSIGDRVPVQGGGAVPAIDTRTLKTRLMVESGETVVLGGIYQKKHRTTIAQVPVLGDIPLIGALFTSTRERRAKTELLIFVTPTILKQEVDVD